MSINRNSYANWRSLILLKRLKILDAMLILFKSWNALCLVVVVKETQAANAEKIFELPYWE